MMTLKVISRLLEYPSEALWLHRDELIEALEQADELPVAVTLSILGERPSVERESFYRLELYSICILRPPRVVKKPPMKGPSRQQPGPAPQRFTPLSAPVRCKETDIDVGG